VKCILTNIDKVLVCTTGDSSEESSVEGQDERGTGRAGSINLYLLQRLDWRRHGDSNCFPEPDNGMLIMLAFSHAEPTMAHFGGVASLS
jgi:hypothetical protein